MKELRKQASMETDPERPSKLVVEILLRMSVD
jgi:hypothetical protein